MDNKLAIDNHNIISTENAIEIIKTSALSLKNNHDLAFMIPSILLRGAPGVGKSSIVRAVADELKIGFVDVRLAQMERVDVCGLPSVHDGMTEWNVPSFWPRDPNSSGIIFFDEITSAPADVQVAAYSIILDRKIPNSNYKLPDGWLIVAAGNRACDRAVVKTLSSALANRFVHFEIEANVKDWIDWAVQHDISPAVTGFVQYRPGYLFTMEKQNLEQGWPSPRSWERVSNMISMFSDNDELMQKIVFGLIGPAVGVEFLAFYKINKQFDNVLEVLTNPKAAVKIPTRSDEKHAYVSAVVYHLWRGTNAADQKRRVDGFFRIANELSNDFCTMIAKAAMQGNATVKSIDAMKMLMTHKSYKALSERFTAEMKSKIKCKI